MSKTRLLSKRVPSGMYEKLLKMVDACIYMEDPEYRPIFEAIKNQPELTLKKIQYELKAVGINKSVARMKQIAIACNLPYKL